MLIFLRAQLSILYILIKSNVGKLVGSRTNWNVKSYRLTVSGLCIPENSLGGETGSDWGISFGSSISIEGRREREIAVPRAISQLLT